MPDDELTAFLAFLAASSLAAAIDDEASPLPVDEPIAFLAGLVAAA
jgi:hypothetical protein